MIRLSLLVMTAFLVFYPYSGCADEQYLSREGAIKMAEEYASSIGRDTINTYITVSSHSTPCNKYFGIERYENAVELFDEIYKDHFRKLIGKLYWAVYFSPIQPTDGSMRVDGDFAVFIDMETGQVLTSFP